MNLGDRVLQGPDFYAEYVRSAADLVEDEAKKALHHLDLDPYRIEFAMLPAIV